MKGFVICVRADSGPPAILASIVTNCSECHCRVYVSPATIDVARQEKLMPVCVRCLPIEDLAMVGSKIEALAPAQRREYEEHIGRVSYGPQDGKAS